MNLQQIISGETLLILCISQHSGYGTNRGVSTLKQLRIYLTDQKKEMDLEKRVQVKNGKADFKLNKASFTTLMSE